MTTREVTDIRWLAALRRYVLASAAGHLVWEILQFPLYTFWRTHSLGQIAFDVGHCTLGDVMIATLAMVSALVVVGRAPWPGPSFGRVAGVTLAIGVGYTIYSEWLNVVVRKSWAYADAMPVVPVIGTGLTPLLQWLIVPVLALWWARRA